jgi:hypothetical protein
MLQGDPHAGEQIAADRGFDIRPDRNRRFDLVQDAGERVAITHLQLDLCGHRERPPAIGKPLDDFRRDVVAMHHGQVPVDQPGIQQPLESIGYLPGATPDVHARKDVEFIGQLQIGRYYLLPMLDMWTDVFASPGWRTTGAQAGNFLITPPGWNGTVPAGMTRISAPTPYVWVIGRTKTDGPPDYDAVHKIQAGYKVTMLSDWGKTPRPVEVKIDPSVDMKTPPKIQVDTMPAAKYFAYAAELLKLHPPHLTDEPILAQMKRIGIEPGKSFDIDTVSPAVKKALEGAPEAGQRLMEWKLPTLARVVNHWSMNTDTMGVYGNYYLKRANVTQQGLGANLPEDAIYPLNLGDEAGRPLDGANKYTLHFEKGATPPVNAFWSVTLYDQDGFQVANSLNRFAVSSWMPFKYSSDGSLTLYFQNESPGGDREANWLPSPKGAFNLTMRLYAPKSDVLTGKWNPPPITRAQVLPSLGAQ